MKTLKYPLLILVFTLSAHAADPVCDQGFAELAQHAADRARDRFTVSKSEAQGLIAYYRDQARDFIMRLKKRPYPISALEDATPLKANLLAKAAVKNKSVAEDAPIPISKIKEELTELLRRTERYPADFSAFLEDTAMLQARLEAMERALQRGEVGARNITLSVPVPKVDAAGNITELAAKEIKWDNHVKFDIELANLRKELKRRLEGPRFWQSKQEAYALEAVTEDHEPIVYDAMEHIYRVKKLDVYRGEYLDTLSRMAARKEPVDLDPELKGLYDRVLALYDGNGGLKKDYHAPYWAWKRLHWQQFWAELKETATKLRLKITDNETLKSVKDYAKNLSPEERKALGLNKIAETVSFMGKNIYVRTLMGVGGSFLGGGGLVTTGLDLWQQFKLESAEKENCAAAASDAKFRACVQDFLQSKFTVAAIKTIVFGDESFLDDTSKIKDPKVRKEVEDLINRRKSYLGSEIQKKENADALDKAIKDVQGTQDPSSDAFREKLITSPRPEIFVFGLTGGNDDKTTMYLGFQHPGQFKKNKDLVLQILAEGDPDKRKALLTQLREKGADELADDVDGLISDREDYLADPAKYLKRGGHRKPAPVKPKVSDDGKPDPKAKPDAADKPDKKDGDAEVAAKKTDKDKPSDERDDTN